MAILLANSAALATAPEPPSGCAAIENVRSVLDRPELNYLMIGEYHGTVEMPGFAGDVACHAAAGGRSIIFAIEMPASDQPAFDAYLASEGGPEARRNLLEAPAWQEQGGRTTQAILELVEQVRMLGLRHPIRIVAFDSAPQRGTSPRREAEMAARLIEARRSVPGSLVIAFTGAGHADKEGFTSQTPPFPAAAGHLPAAETLSLTFARVGGLYWGCQAPDGASTQGCTAYPMPPREPAARRGIVLDPTLRGGFDGVYSTGGAYTASRPAAAD